ncbi:MAG: heat-inducible transcriptional repressor HrcA [Coriobacteriia bacterium]|nr:heat-inducible transcriptional repressor HrcA [Coriobacteriia bacterium]
MLNDRRRRVLRALVEEYVSSATPVGSKTLVDRYELACSPATVRSELSILEETGYVVQPHVSAGRMPTDIGYRSFVDDLIERRAGRFDTPATSTIGHAAEVDDLMRTTAVALTRLTDCLAVSIAPSVTVARVKRLDLLSLAPRRALFVLITESGQVVNRSIELADEAAPELLADMERALNAAVVGKRACEIRPLRAALVDADRAGADASVPLMGRVLDEILDALNEADRDRFFHVGVPALLAQPEFHDADRAGPLIEFLEDGIAVLEALSEALATREMTVRIGHENRRVELGNVSIVATSYSTGSSEGVVGVVGPTRMDYGRAMGAVHAVARELSQAMGGE